MVEESVRAHAETQIEFSRRLVELGDTSAIVHAVRLCLFGELPIPDWLAPHVEAAMLFYFREGGKEQGRKGGNVAQFRNQKMHRERHRVVLHEIARGGKPGAYRRAAEKLKGTFAHGRARQIGDSYRMIEAIYTRLKEPI